MQAVATEGRFRFVVNSRENEFDPPHVHVWMGSEDVCRIELNSGGFMQEAATGGASEDQASLRAPCRDHQKGLGQHAQEIDRMGAMLVKNADRMMTSANPVEEGIDLVFADGCRGLVPFAHIPEVKGLPDLVAIELPNPYQLILHNSRGEAIYLPWDFARHYCDASYPPRVEATGAGGRQAIGSRIRQLREAARMTQEELATAGIGRVTLARIENRDQPAKYKTLEALAAGLGRPVGELMASWPSG